MANLPANYVSPEVVAKHRAQLVRYEEELRAERKLRRNADGEIIKLRAAINGVQLNDSEVDELLAQKLDAEPRKASTRYVSSLLLNDSVISPRSSRCVWSCLRQS